MIEEVARLEALERLPATLPEPSRGRGAADAAPASAPGRGRRAGGTGPRRGGGVELHRAGYRRAARPGRRARRCDSPTRCRPRSPSCARRCSARCSTSRGGTPARAPRTLRLFETGAIYRPRAGGELPEEPRHLAALLAGPSAPPSWRNPEPRPADFFAAKGALEALMAALRLPLERASRHAAVPAPGTRRGGLVAGARVGWLGEIHPSVAERWELRGTVAGFELDLDRLPQPADRHLRGSDQLPGGPRGPRGRRRRRRAGGRGPRRRCAGPGRHCSPAPRCSTSTPTPSELGADRVSAGAPAALPGRGPDAHRRGGRHSARADRRRRSRPSTKGGCGVPSVAVFGAAGFAGALAARLLHRHPEFDLRAITARADAGRPLAELYPQHRVPLVLEELDLDRHADGLDAAIVAYPHGASAEVVAELRARGVRVVDLSRRLPPARRRRRTRSGTGSIRPRADRPGGLRTARARLPGTDRRRRRSSPTRAATPPRRCSRWRRWRAAG